MSLGSKCDWVKAELDVVLEIEIDEFGDDVLIFIFDWILAPHLVHHYVAAVGQLN